jgi:hypothetical protein
MAIDTTVGGETAVSYSTVSYADKYFRDHYSIAKNTLWASLSVARKESALRRATQQIETLKFLDSEYLHVAQMPLALLLNDDEASFGICKAFEFQRLQFPRNVDVSSQGDYFVPVEVMDAQCEQAVHLLNFDDSALLTIGSGIVAEAVTAGAVKSYTKYTEGVSPTYISPMAAELLRPFFRLSTRMRRQ